MSRSDFRFSDAFLALFVVAIALLLLIPIPTPLIDVLIAFNISFAVLLLLVGLYMPNALALLAFPTLLLLTTLFRLGLNIASTRLILSQGFAGQVISAFGNFLIQDEIVVGLIIFAIITVVNFVVVTRGASRVSEVAARFSLEALPGKQMAIDSDLRSGLITAEEAQQKREDLRKESQLYGAMDGAMKFVQGDVIAGVFIIFVNIIAGMYLGVRAGMSLPDAVDKYTKLTVGDGLVTQIPALLISICAGIVVTRISSAKNSTLGLDLKAQILANPVLLMVAGALALGLSVLGGLPTVPFMIVAVFLLASGYILLKRKQKAAIASDEQEADDFGGSSSAEGADNPILVYLDPQVLFPEFSRGVGQYRRWWRSLQQDCYQETGINLPGLRVFEDRSLSASSYKVTVNDVPAFQGSIPKEALLVEVNPENARILGLPVLESADHPLGGARIFWTTDAPAGRKICEAGQIKFFEPIQLIMFKTAGFFGSHPEEAVSLTEVHAALKRLEKKYPGLALEAVAGEFINVARLTEVLQELARQGFNVRDVRQVLEGVAAYCATYGVSMVQQGDFDLGDIVGFIRLNRKRHTLARLLSERGTLKVFTLSEEVEGLFEEASLDDGNFSLAVEPVQFEKMKEGLLYVFEPIRSRGILPVSVLCRNELRGKIMAFLRMVNKAVAVVAFEELDPLVTVEPSGVWNI